jgi:head-tail adaptor
MHAGMLKQLITIERRTTAPDGYGGLTDTWAADPTGGVWASLVQDTARMLGSKPTQAQRETPLRETSATIRFRGNANGAPYYSAGRDRVVFRGRYYNIIAAFDPDFTQAWLQLDLVEGEAS